MVVITDREWRWAIGWSLAILLLSCIPYAIVALLTPEGWQFAGVLVNPMDGHSYMAKMRQGFEGHWLFHLTYTPEPHQGAFIFTFYLAMGHLAALTHLPSIWIFHLARLAGGFYLLVAAFRFISYVTTQPHERRLAFALLLSASGLGWLGVIFDAFPIDLWVPEAFVPYSIYATPHFPLAMALMVVIFQRTAWAETHPDGAENPGVIDEAKTALGPSPRPPASILWTALAALVLALILPFALLTVWAVLAVFLVWLYAIERCWPWPQLWHTLSAVVFTAPVIFYDYWVSTTNPILAGWGAQNITQAPRILDLALGYGLVGFFALAGGWFIIRRGKTDAQRGEWLILWWAVTTLVLVYFPFDLQRRLINGLHIPLCILAAIGLKRWLANSSLKLKYRRQLTTVVVTLSALGTLFVWGVPLLAMSQLPTISGTTALLFMRQEEVAALTWLRENASAEQVVLASPRMSMFIPGQAGTRVFYGHPFETIEAEKRRNMVEAFYRGEIGHMSLPVDFIIYGPSEQALGQPAGLKDLPILFSTGNVMIYKANDR